MPDYFHSKDCALRHGGEYCDCGFHVFGESCSVCLRPFTQKEWEDRHTDPGTGGDCHERCCPLCNAETRAHRLDSKRERKRKAI